MYSDEAAIHNISSFLVHCTNRPIWPGRKWQKIVKLCIFRSLSTRSHKLGIKTLTLLLTATDCWETMRRFNIMAIQGTFCPFKGKSKTKFQKGFLVSKSFSFSICFCRVYRVFFSPLLKSQPTQYSLAAAAAQWGHSDFLTRGHTIWELFPSALMPMLLYGSASCFGYCRGTEGLAHTPQKTKVIFCH